MFTNVLRQGKIGKLELKNRFVMPAMGSSHVEPDGRVGKKLIDYYVARAKGGFGLIVTEFACVDPPGKALPGQLMIHSDEYIPCLTKLAAAIHQAGGKAVVQIQHSGRQTTSAVTGTSPVAPSALPCPVNRELPQELSTAEVYELIEKFGDAAMRAQKAGFDGVEIHGAHGYLVAQFLSSYSNKRVDEFGGDLVGKTRFAVEIIKNIKHKCGNDFPLIFRISGDERVEGGRQINETMIISKLLAKAGADAIHVSTGVFASMPWMVAPYNVPTGYLLDAAKQIKSVVNVPVIAVGRINDPTMAEEAVASGMTDFISLGRGSLADPEFPNKVAANRTSEIIPCVACMTRCQGAPGIVPDDKGVSCMINPFTGHEGSMQITQTDNPQSVVIVGGGPGGLMTAWVAAARGHKVTVFEKDSQLGGQFIPAAVPPGKHELARSIYSYAALCKRYGVDIRLNTEADAEQILSLKPDAVVLATGAVPVESKIPNEGIPVAQVVDVLMGKIAPGENNLIVGGGLAGLETCEYLLGQNRRATIIEAQEDTGDKIHPSVKYFITKLLDENNAQILTSTKVESFTKGGAICTDPTGTIELTGFDMVIVALGSEPHNPLEKDLADKVKSLHVIGDAAQPRSAIAAIEEGARLALKL